ncbi:hypothetical protein Hypma_001374 [Hypsizygus marmoreus]|uniref:Uncharacterized protein n=1 Tax=Hypsizygus marmoreus TaxID=39966 RepID=A0A369K0S0_HYPMA|nr:hypothetical protein Hypma_001374 [Hypsizygus marmoreus]
MSHPSFPSTSFAFSASRVQATTASASHPSNPSSLHQPPLPRPQVAQDGHGQALAAFTNPSDVERSVACIHPHVEPSRVSSGATAVATQNPPYPIYGRSPNGHQVGFNPSQTMESRTSGATHLALAGQSPLTADPCTNTLTASEHPLTSRMHFIPYVPTSSYSMVSISQSTAAPLPSVFNARKRKGREEQRAPQMGHDPSIVLQDNLNRSVIPGFSEAIASDKKGPEDDQRIPNGKKPKNRRLGACPFCGQSLARDHPTHIGTHIGRPKPEDDMTPCACPFYSRKDGGVILYSVDGLTPAEIERAQANGWYLYDKGVSEKLVGPGKHMKPKGEEKNQLGPIKDGKELRRMWLDHIEKVMEKLEFTPLPGWKHPKDLPYPHGLTKSRRTKPTTSSANYSQCGRKYSGQQQMASCFKLPGYDQPSMSLVWLAPTVAESACTTGTPSESSSSSSTSGHVSGPQPMTTFDIPRLPQDWLQQGMPILNPAVIQDQQPVVTAGYASQEYDQLCMAAEQPLTNLASSEEFGAYTYSPCYDQRQYTARQQPAYQPDWQGWSTEPPCEQIPAQDDQADSRFTLGHAPPLGLPSLPSLDSSIPIQTTVEHVQSQSQYVEDDTVFPYWPEEEDHSSPDSEAAALDILDISAIWSRVNGEV